VGGKNNEFPCWEIQNSTWLHDVRVSMELDKLLEVVHTAFKVSILEI